MPCNHKWKVSKDVSDIYNTVKIHKCKKCGKELIEINGYVHERRKIENPENLL